MQVYKDCYKAKKTNSVMTILVMKHRMKNSGIDPQFFDPLDDAYNPYFKKFEGKRAPNCTAVEDLALCKAYAAVSEVPTVGMDQMVETFWLKFLKALFCSLGLR